MCLLPLRTVTGHGVNSNTKDALHFAVGRLLILRFLCYNWHAA